MEIEKIIDENSLKIFQCYCMFYGEVPEYKSEEDYYELYMRCQAMMTLLSEFGYNKKRQAMDRPEICIWYHPQRYFYELKVSPELDIAIDALNQKLKGKSLEYIEEYYKEIRVCNPLFDEEITTRIGEIIKEYVKTKRMNEVDVLRQMTNILEAKRMIKSRSQRMIIFTTEEIRKELESIQKYHPIKNLEDMIWFIREKLSILYDQEKPYSILEPQYKKLVINCLPPKKTGVQKVIQ